MKKMMKMALVAVMLMSTVSASAQFSKKENNREPDRFHMGMRFAFTSNSLSWDKIYGNKTGAKFETKALPFVSAGLAFDFQVAPVPLFLETGIYYVNKGCKIDQTVWNYDEYAHLHMVEFPLVASYHINVAPNLFINPFFGGFYSIGFPDGDLWKEGEDVYGDAGLRFGCGMNFGRLYLNLGYDAGLVNIKRNDKYEGTFRTGTFFATIGFNMAGSR